MDFPLFYFRKYSQDMSCKDLWGMGLQQRGYRTGNKWMVPEFLTLPVVWMQFPSGLLRQPEEALLLGEQV